MAEWNKSGFPRLVKIGHSMTRIYSYTFKLSAFLLRGRGGAHCRDRWIYVVHRITEWGVLFGLIVPTYVHCSNFPLRNNVFFFSRNRFYWWLFIYKKMEKFRFSLADLSIFGWEKKTENWLLRKISETINKQWVKKFISLDS